MITFKQIIITIAFILISTSKSHAQSDTVDPNYNLGLSFGKAAKVGYPIVIATENMGSGIQAKKLQNATRGPADYNKYPGPYFIFIEHTISALTTKIICGKKNKVSSEIFIRNVSPLTHLSTEEPNSDHEFIGDSSEEDNSTVVSVKKNVSADSIAEKVDFNLSKIQFIAAIKAFTDATTLKDPQKGPIFWKKLLKQKIFTAGNFFDLADPATIARIASNQEKELSVSMNVIREIEKICDNRDSDKAVIIPTSSFSRGFAAGFNLE